MALCLGCKYQHEIKVRLEIAKTKLSWLRSPQPNKPAMLRLILAIVAVLILAASLTSRLSEVRAAGNKSGSKPSAPITGRYDLGKSGVPRHRQREAHFERRP
jgi:hypothetical protein